MKTKKTMYQKIRDNKELRRKEKQKEETIEAIAKGIRFVLGFALIVAVVFFLFAMFKALFKNEKTETPIKTEVPTYDPPKVADTVKNDWVKDPNICIEKRIILEQILNDIER